MRTLVILLLPLAACSPDSSAVSLAMRLYADPLRFEGPQYAGCERIDRDVDPISSVTWDDAGRQIRQRECWDRDLGDFISGRTLAWSGERQLGTIEELRGSDGTWTYTPIVWRWEDGLQVAATSPTGGEEWTYDADGLRTRHLVLGTAGSVERWTWADTGDGLAATVAGPAGDTDLAWDDADRLIRRASDSVVETWEYDGERLASWTRAYPDTGEEYTWRWSYDADGRVTAIDEGGGVVIRSDYDCR